MHRSGRYTILQCAAMRSASKSSSDTQAPKTLFGSTLHCITASVHEERVDAPRKHEGCIRELIAVAHVEGVNAPQRGERCICDRRLVASAHVEGVDAL